MEDRRVQSTLEKLQGTYEEKVLKIDRIKQVIQEKESFIDELSKEQPSLAMQYAEKSLELANLQKQHAGTQSVQEKEENSLLAKRRTYELNEEEINLTIEKAKSLMVQGEDSLRDLESHHRQLQDLHNTLQETLLMMHEENATYEYELSDYQALQTLADEMEIEETLRQAEDIRQVKREVQAQIAAYVFHT